MCFIRSPSAKPHRGSVGEFSCTRAAGESRKELPSPSQVSRVSGPYSGLQRHEGLPDTEEKEGNQGVHHQMCFLQHCQRMLGLFAAAAQVVLLSLLHTRPLQRWFVHQDVCLPRDKGWMLNLSGRAGLLRGTGAQRSRGGI